MLSAKFVAPLPLYSVTRQAGLDRVFDDALSLFTVPAGYLLTEQLAAIIEQNQRLPLWLRLDAEDRDPATFLLSLIAAAQRLSPEIGKVTLQDMRRQPGPVAGWSALFVQLGRELRELLSARCAIVIENVHHLVATHSTLELFCRYLLPALAPGTCVILTSQNALPNAVLPKNVAQYRDVALRVDLGAAQALAERAQVLYPTPALQRTIRLFDGRAEALIGLFAVNSRLGTTLVEQVVDSARDSDDLLTRLARAWLSGSDGSSLDTLALAMQLEYIQPGLCSIVLGHGDLPESPWFQPLADEWTHLRDMWYPALSRVFRNRLSPSPEQMQRAADYLLDQDATEQAISLYLNLGNAARAAEVIAGQAETLINLGQWETLTGWLNRLPTHVLHAYPTLIHTQGEIAAAHGDRKSARRAFAVATGLFSVRNDRDGACSSLLAESAVAAQEGNLAQAQASARTALDTARAFQLAWHQCWAAWQIGSLMVSQDQFDDALGFFELAAEAADQLADPFLSELLHKAFELAASQRGFKHERESLREAYLTVERQEQETVEMLRQLLDDPLKNIELFVERHGWSRTPLMVKLPAMTETLSDDMGRTGLWTVLRGAMNLRRRFGSKTSLSSEVSAISRMDPFLTADQVHGVESLTPGASALVLPATIAGNVPRLTQSTNLEFRPAAPSLVVYLLGTFRATFNEVPIENLQSSKGRTLFKYLLTHHDKPISRDLLMEMLWPNADPDAARNRLNVALHGLRHAFRLTTETPIVLFEENAYRLNPDLQLWLDVEDFVRHVRVGRNLEESGDIARAVVEYELAAGLYQGDFLEEDVYDDWTILTRERLRGDYLDILDRLSRIHFAQAQYSICGTLCKLILARDNCSEPAHRRLMRCYARQGQPHLALRQYQVSFDALHEELNVTPASATTELYEQIRRGERV